MNLEGLTEKVTNGRWKTVYYEDCAGEIVAKTCGKCSEVKALDGFSKSKSSLGNRDSTCKECRAVSDKKWRNANKERMAENWHKWYETNKEHHKEVVRNWKRNNLERTEEIKRDWTRNNPDRRALSEQKRRARKNFLPDNFTAEQLGTTLNYFGGCALTGDDIDIHWDHVIPLATNMGGTTFGNMIPLRYDLNCSKHDANIFEWFETAKQRFNLQQERFDSLISWLASANAMSVEEYRAYVYECHANPNEIIDAEAN